MKRNFSIILLSLLHIFQSLTHNTLLQEIEIGTSTHKHLSTKMANFKTTIDERIKDHDLTFNLRIENQNEHLTNGIILISTVKI